MGSALGSSSVSFGLAAIVASPVAWYVRSLELIPSTDSDNRVGYPWDLPAVRALGAGLDLDPRVTYLVGENGTGKSTLIEALAIAAGMNPEGGTRNFSFSTRESHSPLGASLRLVRGTARPRTEFFLRAESFFTAASYLEALPAEAGRSPLDAYGGRSLHEQSHGESFLAVMLNRFGPNGFYLLDEPEAALSPQNCLTLLRRLHELVEQGSQFVIATHSPIVLAYPEATIFNCGPQGLEKLDYEDTEPVRLTRAFLLARDNFLQKLFT